MNTIHDLLPFVSVLCTSLIITFIDAATDFGDHFVVRQFLARVISLRLFFCEFVV